MRDEKSSKDILDLDPLRLNQLPRKRDVVISIVFTTLISFIVLCLLIVLLQSGTIRGIFQEGLPIEPNYYRIYIAENQKMRIENALIQYFLDKDNYPESLENLYINGYLKHNDLSYPWKDNYIYYRDKQGFILISPIE